jgi:epsin
VSLFQKHSEDDDLKKALELSKKEEQDRIKTVEKYNELSLTEDWEADSK